MRTQPPQDYWQWKRALASSGLKAGVKATALAWETYCWDWAQGRSEDEVLASVRPPSLEAFVQHHRDDVNERTVRRHFRALKEAGLLARRRGHSRWGPDVYVPRVPAAAAQSSTGHPRPVLDANTGHENPLLEANTGHSRPVSGVNTGHLASQHRTSGDLSPYSPEVPQTPLPPPPVGDGAEDGSTAEGGGRSSEDRRQATAAALDAISGLMPTPTSRQLDGTNWRQDCEPWVWALLDTGWRPNALARRVNREPWTGARSVSGVLRTRLVDLEGVAVPEHLRQDHPTALHDTGDGSPSLATIASRRAAEEQERQAAVPPPAEFQRLRPSRRPDPTPTGKREQGHPHETAPEQEPQEVGA